jgi:hypothetical protein
MISRHPSAGALVSARNFYCKFNASVIARNVSSVAIPFFFAGSAMDPTLTSFVRDDETFDSRRNNFLRTPTILRVLFKTPEGPSLSNEIEERPFRQKTETALFTD